MTVFNPCFVIPNYNHAHGFEKLLSKICELGVPVIVVNDGSDQQTTDLLTTLPSRFEKVTVLHSATNTGKGGAVKKGLLFANQAGFTHALQVDADGQHDLGDAKKFFELSRNNPAAVICGCPVYDDSVPMVRFLCRYLTHSLVWFETLSFNIRDSMCGFRVYPLAETVSVLQKYRIGKRMDFDTEILVKLYWEAVEIQSVPTRVIYPPDGSSHFKMVKDNVLNTLMHFRLVGGMLLRIPNLILRRHNDRKARHWAMIREKGSYAGMRLLLWIYTFFGRWLFLIILHPVVLYYSTSYSTARNSSRDFLSRVAAQGGAISKVTWRTVYKHFYAFGECAIDKIAAWAGDMKRDQVKIHGAEALQIFARSGTGALFIGSHLGNLELCRALGEKAGKVKINAVVFNKNAAKFQSILSKTDSRAELNLIHVEEMGADTAIILRQKVDVGETVVIVGDRTPVNNAGRVRHIDFLGEKAPFAEGPFILAGLMQCPVYLIFCIKEGGEYNIYLEHFSDTLKFPREQRDTLLTEAMQAYADRLAYYCKKAPLQWFNFFDFWSPDIKSDIKQNIRQRRA